MASGVGKLAQVYRAVRHAASPAERYRHARVLHGVRVALAMLTSIVFTTGIHIPHGIWASVSLLVVIGGLQHQGNIRQKAFERALGTAFGAILGLAWVAQYAVIGSVGLTYALLSITAGICGYHAIGKGGYIALLTAITMCIVAGHGDDSIEIGLWRTANVLVGIGIALLFSFALPLHATYSWRHALAMNLRECAGLCKRLLGGPRLSAEAQIAAFGGLSRRLVALRALMPSVAKESDVALARLEDIQREHRALLSALEMLASAPLAAAASTHREAFERMFGTEGRAIRGGMLRMARALRSGRVESLLERTDEASTIDVSPSLDVAVPGALNGPAWLLSQIATQTNRLRRMLLDASRSGSLWRR